MLVKNFDSGFNTEGNVNNTSDLLKWIKRPRKNLCEY